jgi:hypothetical protein
MQALTSPDNSNVVVDMNHVDQRISSVDNEAKLKRLSGLILLLCCIASTSLTALSLTKKKSKINYILFGLQFLTTIFVAAILITAATSFFF